MNLAASVWISRVTGSLSMLGSTAIIYIILSCRKRKLAQPKNRLMIMMSGFDVLQAIAIVVATAAIPRDFDVYGARGNQTTCVVQSILMTMGMAVPLYNSSLNMYYLLTIRYNMTSALFSSRVEPLLHLLSILGPLTSAVTFAALGYAGPMSHGSTTCVYIDANSSPRYVFLAFISFCLFFCICSMAAICWSVISQEEKIKKHRFGSTQDQSVSILERKETTKQAMLYSSAFLLTFAFPIIRALWVTLYEDEALVLDILTAIFYPLQGFWNFVFYCRPGVNHVKTLDPSKSLFKAIVEVIFHAECVSNSFLASRSRKRGCSMRRRSNCNAIDERIMSNLAKEDKIEVEIDSHQLNIRPTPHASVTNDDLKTRENQSVQHSTSYLKDEDGDLDSTNTPPQTITTRYRDSGVLRTLYDPEDVYPSDPYLDAEGSEIAGSASIETPPSSSTKELSYDEMSTRDNIHSKANITRRVSLVELSSVLFEVSISSSDDDSIDIAESC